MPKNRKHVVQKEIPSSHCTFRRPSQFVLRIGQLLIDPFQLSFDQRIFDFGHGLANLVVRGDRVIQIVDVREKRVVLLVNF